VIDSHAHLYFDRFDEDRDATVARARESGVEQVINIGIDVTTSEQSIDLARADEGLYATVGVHPTTPVENLDDAVSALRELALHNKDEVVAVGEIGLDYYWKDVPHDLQKDKLHAQLALARELELPVIFHCREALDDLFAALESEPSLPGGVFHCFAGGANEVDRALALGFHISFAGNVTYPKAKLLHEAARYAPVDKLLLETDAPFLAPQPRRGKRNEPSFLPFTCKFLAELKGIPEDKLAAQATETTRALFGLR